jgi:hypothetical protein
VTASAEQAPTGCVETRVKTYVLPAPVETPEQSRRRESDRRIFERFTFDYGRDPAGPEDGEAWWALLRERKRNLRHQVRAPAQPFEPDGGRWRRWTAALTLGRINRAETATRRPDNGREPRVRRYRRSTAARARDRPRRPGPEPPPPLARGARVSAVPRLVVELSIEGRTVAYVRCSTFEELRVGRELLRRDAPVELLSALGQLLDVLADRAADLDDGQAA